MEEFEIKFLEVDVPSLEKKLLAIRAKKVADYDYSRVLMDYPDHRLDEKDGWIRLRTDGKETTLTYKERIGGSEEGDEGMKEIEVIVENYEKTFELLKVIGLVVKREERNKRVRYEKGEVVFDIDSWPFIPTYLEIESNSYEKARSAAGELGFDGDKGIIGTAGTIYKKYGFDKNEYSSITFEGMIKK
ncbi:MAG: CYTH domain-containing protein [Patescibacteria group bacterium]